MYHIKREEKKRKEKNKCLPPLAPIVSSVLKVFTSTFDTLF